MRIPSSVLVTAAGIADNGILRNRARPLSQGRTMTIDQKPSRKNRATAPPRANPTPQLLDRLDATLADSGVSIKRAALLQATAAAFGYRNSNVFSAAAKRGELNPPASAPICRVTIAGGRELVVYNDPIAQAAFGFETGQGGDAEATPFRVTPYGNLVACSDAAASAVAPSSPCSHAVVTPDVANMTASRYVIDSTTLASLVSAANSYANDLASSLADGTYDDDSTLAPTEAAIEATAKLERLESALSSVSHAAPAAQAPTAAATLQKIYTARAHTPGGFVLSSHSLAGLNRAIADKCREWMENDPEDWPEDLASLTDRQIIGTYYEPTAEADTPYTIEVSYIDDIPNLHDAAAPLLPNPDLRPQPVKNTVNVTALPARRPHEVHLARMENQYGSFMLASYSRDGLERALADQCRENWAAALNASDTEQDCIGRASPLPADPSKLSDRETIDRYYGALEEYGNDTFETEIVLIDNRTDEPVASAPIADIASHQRPRATAPATVSDRQAENHIDNVQHAMSAAASLLGGNLSAAGSAPADNPTPPPATPLAMTVFGSTYSDRPIDVFTAASRPTTGRFIQTSPTEYHYCVTVDFAAQAGARVDPISNSAAIDYADTLRPDIEFIGGTVQLRSSGIRPTVAICFPEELLYHATSFDDWLTATRTVVSVPGDANYRHPITADFLAQARIGDYSIAVDPEGYATWDVTFFALLRGRDEAVNIADQSADADHYHDAPGTPAWIAGWTGPFEIDVTDGLIELFDI